MIGIGISLTSIAVQQRPPQPHARDTICKAIKDRQHVVATIDGGRVLLEPYAVFTVPGDDLVLEAVRVLGCGAGWSLERFPLSILKAVKAHDISFIPNGAFDPAAYDGALCVVEPIKDIEDALKAHAG